MSANHQPKHITHEGHVVSVFDGSVDVAIVSEAACVSCKMKKACGMDESKEKIITVFTPDAHAFRKGELVEVVMKQAMGFKAIGLVYGIPVFVVMAALALLIQSGMPEMMAGLASLGFLALYYTVIYFFRNRIAREVRFEIRIPKNNQP